MTENYKRYSKNEISKFYASNNALLYYINLARMWAVQDSMPVEDNLYSAKHYAEEASDIITIGQADISQRIDGIKSELLHGDDFISDAENNAIEVDEHGMYVDLSDISDAIDANADDIESVDNKIGDLSLLTTINKNSVVSAINSALPVKADADCTNVVNNLSSTASEYFTGLSFPSTVYENIAASTGSRQLFTYTAPADGWVAVSNVQIANAGYFVRLASESITQCAVITDARYLLDFTIPVRKDAQVIMGTSNSTTFTHFDYCRFIYAKGEV